MGVSPQRRDDWGFAFHVRPVVVEVAGRRQPISPHETHLLLGELGRLPRTRHRAADEIAGAIVHGLAAGCVLPLDEAGRRCVLRALEGVRAAGGLPSGLARLRELLLHSPEPVV